MKTQHLITAATLALLALASCREEEQFHARTITETETQIDQSSFDDPKDPPKDKPRDRDNWRQFPGETR